MALPSETAHSKVRYQTTFFAILNYLLKRFATDDIIKTVDDDISRVRRGSLTAVYYAQQLWKKRLSCGFVYKEKVLKGIFAEAIHSLICQRPRLWWSDHDQALLKDLTHRAKLCNTLQGNNFRNEERQRPSATKTAWRSTGTSEENDHGVVAWWM